MIGFPVFSHLISQPFTHRTHIEIFGTLSERVILGFISIHSHSLAGTFYPPVLKNWYGDTWLTGIYDGDHMKKEEGKL
jgi:hypothetical protein